MKTEIFDETVKDSVLGKLRNYIMNGWPKHRSSCDTALKEYWPVLNELSVHDGIIFRGNRILIPSSLRYKFLLKLHEGHLGQNKCKSKARELMYWPGMSSDIDRLINSCEVCNKYRPQQQKEPLQPHPIPKHPYDRVGVDLFTCDGKDHLIITDYYSSYPEVFQLNRTTSTSLINALRPNFSRYGYPVTLVSDGAPNLMSDEFDTFLKEHCIMHENSSAYFPQSNGMVERAVQTCKNLIIKANETKSDIFKALHAYRTSPLACGKSPAQLFFGRRLRGALPMSSSLLETSSNNFFRKFEKERGKYKMYFDNRNGAKTLKPLSVNDRVRVYDTIKKTWSDLAYVIRFDGPRSYIVKTDNGSVFKRNRVHLKPVAPVFSASSFETSDRNFENVQSDTGHSLSVIPSVNNPIHSAKSSSVTPDQTQIVLPPVANAATVRNLPKRDRRAPSRLNDFVLET